MALIRSVGRGFRTKNLLSIIHGFRRYTGDHIFRHFDIGLEIQSSANKARVIKASSNALDEDLDEDVWVGWVGRIGWWAARARVSKAKHCARTRFRPEQDKTTRAQEQVRVRPTKQLLSLKRFFLHEERSGGRRTSVRTANRSMNSTSTSPRRRRRSGSAHRPIVHAAPPPQPSTAPTSAGVEEGRAATATATGPE